MVSCSKRRAEHLCRDVSEKRFDVVQNVGDVFLQGRGIDMMKELDEERI